VFKGLIEESEGDPSLMQELWSVLSGLSAAEVFAREDLFVPILKQPFEKLLGAGAAQPYPAVSGEGIQFLNDAGSLLRDAKRDMAEALETARLLRENVSRLHMPKSTDLGDYGKWESFYVKHLAPLPLLKEKLHEGLTRMQILPPSFLKEEERAFKETISAVHRAFSGFYGESLPAWEKGDGAKPFMIEDMPLILSKKRGGAGSQSPALCTFGRHAMGSLGTDQRKDIRQDGPCFPRGPGRTLVGQQAHGYGSPDAAPETLFWGCGDEHQ
jgi:hypothetical protein